MCVFDPKIPAGYLRAGLSVLPAKRAKKFPSIGSWKTYRDRLPTEIEVETWFSNNHDALCIVCGKVSGNLEILDFDHNGELFPVWKDRINQKLFAQSIYGKGTFVCMIMTGMETMTAGHRYMNCHRVIPCSSCHNSAGFKNLGQCCITF